jgi:hypothetical protein
MTFAEELKVNVFESEIAIFSQKKNRRRVNNSPFTKKIEKGRIKKRLKKVELKKHRKRSN